MTCHNANGSASTHTFTLAGTVFSSPQALPDGGLWNAQILVTDGARNQLTLTSNGAGNFYTLETLIEPVHVAVLWGNQKTEMAEPVPFGRSCNECHSVPALSTDAGYAPAPGRVFVPLGPGGAL